jgi:hypothetical protein
MMAASFKRREEDPTVKYLFAISLEILCLLPSHALQQGVFSAPVIDKSSAGAPFEVSGKVAVRESLRANQLEWSWGEKVIAENVSGKAIILFVATITEVGRHSAPVGRRVAPGDGPTYRLEDDRFFNEKLIEPGESLILRDTKPGSPDVACCVDPLAEAHDPSGEYRLLVVQFNDGSVFGDSAEARNSLMIRATILRGLHDLIQSYQDAGEPGYSAQLKDLRSYLANPSLAPKTEEQPPFFTTAIFTQILAKYETGGINAALNETRQILKTAEKHAAMIAVAGKPAS